MAPHTICHPCGIAAQPLYATWPVWAKIRAVRAIDQSSTYGISANGRQARIQTTTTRPHIIAFLEAQPLPACLEEKASFVSRCFNGVWDTIHLLRD
jgi:hypothetical protein